jgi:hypothetical protein
MKQLHPVEFLYRGGYRTVEPFALGVVFKGDTDNQSLVCYQTGGYSELRQVAGWKLYRLNDIEDIVILKDAFPGDRPGYDPDNLQVTEVICCVRLKKAVVPEPKLPIMEYLSHNEVMTRFRYAHPALIPALCTEIWPEPLMVRPFSERIRATIVPQKQVLDIRALVDQTA